MFIPFFPLFSGSIGLNYESKWNTHRSPPSGNTADRSKVENSEAIPENSESLPGSAASLTAAYLDELSTLGESTVAEFYQEKGFALSTLNPEFLLQPARLEDLKGGDPATNARIIQRILRGEERGPKREAVLLNAGAALFVAGKSRTVDEGWALAAEMIDAGRALQKRRQ